MSFNPDDLFGEPSTQNMDVSNVAATYDYSDPVYRSIGVMSSAPITGDRGMFDLDGLSLGYHSVDPSAGMLPPMMPTLRKSDMAAPPKPQLRKKRTSTPPPVAYVAASVPEVSTAPTLPEDFIVEPSHFHTRSSISGVVSTLYKALTDLRVSIEFNESKCKLVCFNYTGYGSLRFVVRVFTTLDGVQLVEFQRRNGRVSDFSSIFDTVYSDMEAMIDQSVGKSNQSSSQWTPRSFDRSFVPPVSSLETSESDLVPLIDMLQDSSCNTSQVEGLRVIGKLSELSSNIPTLVSAGILSAVVRLFVESNSLSVLRGVVAIIANIAANSSCVNLTSDMEEAVQNLVSLSSSTPCVLLKRACVRAISELSTHGSFASFLAREGHDLKLQHVMEQNCGDKVLLECGQSALSNISIAC